jgi:hypothetical protein
MELKGFSRALVGGVTVSWTSISSVQAESVSTRKACTPSCTRVLMSLMVEYRLGTTIKTESSASTEQPEATPITSFAS